MEAIAKTKYLKGSPRKARLVIDLIRGQEVSRALSILKFTDKRATGPIAKCLNSAIANATYLAEQQNIAIDPDDLWVKACFVDMGPTKGRRRMRPAPQGRAYREQRHYCHITIEVTSEEREKSEKEIRAEAAKAKKAATKKAAGETKKSKSVKAAPSREKKDSKAAKTAEKEVVEQTSEVSVGVTADIAAATDTLPETNVAPQVDASAEDAGVDNAAEDSEAK